MYVLILLGAITLSKVLFSFSEESDKKFIIFTTVLLIFYSGFRHEIIGADTDSYKWMFNEVKTISWGTVFENFTPSFLVRETQNRVEAGYTLLVKIFQLFSGEYRHFLIFVAAAFHIPLARWIYKYSLDPYVSYIIYVCLYFSFFGATGIRQTMATTIAFFCGYPAAIKRKPIKFILIILLACTIHRTAIVLMPFYIILNYKISRKQIIAAIMAMVGITIFRFPFLKFFGRIFGYNSYAEQYDGAGTPTFTLMMCLIVAVLFIFIDKIDELQMKVLTKAKYVNNSIVAFLIAFIIAPLAYVDPSLLRLVHYYSLFMLILLPAIVFSFKEVDRVIVRVISCVTIMGLYLFNNPQFFFMWSEIK